jgi:uncharacterized cupin superfamily protein
MQATVLPGISMWSAWQSDRNFFFNSFFVETPHGNLVVDPLPGDDALFAAIAGRGGIAWIVVTNRDHERASRAFAERFGAKLAASEADAPLLTGPVDRTLREDDLILGARVVTFDGLKTPGEIALWLRDRRTAIIGDALWGDPAGSLRLMPAEKLADPATAILSLRRLRALNPRHVLVGDGTCIYETAMTALQRVYETRDDVYVHRINLDELVMRDEDDSAPARYAAQSAEIGFAIGAERLGYRAVRLQPGKVFCPLHWHSIEEELFIVWDGEPSIRTEHGSYRLRRGDLVAFPARREGAHQLLNESAAPATVILIALDDAAHDDCFYPDSRKSLIGARDLIVRDEPALDYFDGE